MARSAESITNGRPFPVRPVAAGVLIVCVALAVSAGYSYVTLTRLRDDYLASRGADLVNVLDARTRGRGPGGRSDVNIWRAAIEETLATQEDTVAFIEVVNARGEVVARGGEEREGLYLFERPLPTPGRGAGRGSPTPQGWRVRAGLDARATLFIARAANLQVAAAAVAIIALLTTAVWLGRTARRFVALRARELQARRLADLGQMAATLAHEIRNPLGAVKGLTQVAREQMPAEHGAQSHLQTVVGEAERLERLVDDLLRFARPRTLEISRFDLAGALQRARETVRVAHPDTPIEVRVANAGDDGALWIRSDADGLRQVLLNVLLNAVQATPTGGTVRVAARALDSAQAIEVNVEDDGPGLQGRDPEELFSPFATTKTRGSGLGLPVSRQIVEQLGGSIRITDGPQGGACCTINLPREPHS
ncbi:MAG: ATP-binding protein [Acidobacteriota bacterium]